MFFFYSVLFFMLGICFFFVKFANFFYIIYQKYLVVIIIQWFFNVRPDRTIVCMINNISGIFENIHLNWNHSIEKCKTKHIHLSLYYNIVLCCFVYVFWLYSLSILCVCLCIYLPVLALARWKCKFNTPFFNQFWAVHNWVIVLYNTQ